VLLAPYTVVGVGAGLDDTGHFNIVVLAHDEPTFAQQNLLRLEQVITSGSSMAGRPWRDSFAIREIDANGAALVALLDVEQPQTAIDALTDKDSLVLTG